MAKKRKESLVDSFRRFGSQGDIYEEAKNLVEQVTDNQGSLSSLSVEQADFKRQEQTPTVNKKRTKEGQNRGESGAEKGQERGESGAKEGRKKGETGTNKDQIKDNSLSDKEQIKGEAGAKEGQSSKRGETGAEKGQIKGETGAKVVRLSKAQSQIYLWLEKNLPEGQFTANEMVESLSMAYTTVRKGIEKLQKADILCSEYDRVQQVNHYTLNMEIPVHLSRKGETGAKEGRNRDKASYNSSSSSLKEITTTTDSNELLSNITKVFHSDPELWYWRKKELEPKQIQAWIMEFGIPLPKMIKSLKHCAFELHDLGREQGEDGKKPVTDVFSWFYKRIKQYGHYAPPQGYKSFQDKEIEAEQEEAKELKKKADKLAKMREEKAQEAERLVFEEMMQNPDSEAYKACYEKISQIAKKRPGTKTFEDSMREKFREMRENGEL